MKKYIYFIFIALNLYISQFFSADSDNESLECYGPHDCSIEWFRYYIITGDLNKIEYLLKNGVHTQNAWQFLIDAMENSKFKPKLAQSIGRLFLKYSIDINKEFIYYEDTEESVATFSVAITKRIKKKYAKTPLEYAICSKKDLQYIKTLIKLGASTHSPSQPLIEALNLLTQNSNFNIRNQCLGTYVFDCFNLLIDEGADLDRQNLDKYTVLHTLSNYVSTIIKQTMCGQIIFLLLSSGANTLIENNRNHTFFYYLNKSIYPAIKNNLLLDVVKEFIQETIISKTKTKGAQNALLLAAYLNNPKWIYLLLRKGAYFASENYQLYFNNLIADKPLIHEVIKQYNKEVASKIFQEPNLIPDLANIIAEYEKHV